MNLNYYFGIAYLCGFLLRSYFESLQFVTNGNDSQGYAPVLQIVRRNNRFVFGILSTLVLFNIAFQFSFFENSFHWILSKIGNFLSLLLRFFNGKKYNEVPLENDLSHNVLPDMKEIMDQPPNPFALFLEKIVYIVITLGLWFLFFYTIYRCIKRISRNLQKKNSESLSITDDFEPIETFERIYHTPKRSSIHSHIKGNLNQQVRQLYRGKIISLTKHNGYSLNLSDTPNERIPNIKKTTGISIKLLTDIYNKARYSDQNITKEELHKIKKSE